MAEDSSLLISRKDIEFILFKWLDVESYLGVGEYAEHDRNSVSAVLDLFESLAKEQFAPHNRKNDTHEPQFDGENVTLNPEIKEAHDAFCDVGLLAAPLSTKFGGISLPYTIDQAGLMFIIAGNPTSIGYAFLTKANANLLLQYGSQSLIERFAKPELEGQACGTMCLSEPHAGSNLADIRTRAVPLDDGRYRLFGSKMWISGGDHKITPNIVHAVLAKVPDDNGKLPSGTSNISLFVVPKYVVDENGNPTERNDVAVAGLNHKMGYRGTVNCALNFGEGHHTPEGEPGAIGEIIGERGKGLSYMFHMMNEARIGVGAAATAIGYSGYLRSVYYAKDRLQGRRLGEKDQSTPQVPIIAHPDVRRMLLEAKVYVEGGAAIILYCSQLLDEARIAGDPNDQSVQLLDLLTPIAKSWPSRWCLAANDIAIQVHGGAGYTRDYIVEQLYRDNRLNPIHEGTHGIQGLDLLGRKLARNEVVEILEGRIKQTIAYADKYAILKPLANSLCEYWTAIRRTIDRILSINDVEERLCNASAVLDAMGHIVVGWLWLDMAVAALNELDGDATDEDFYNGKVQACRFFFAWELPKVSAWLKVLDPIDRSALDMKEAWF